MLPAENGVVGTISSHLMFKHLTMDSILSIIKAQREAGAGVNTFQYF